jgi:hypothetical protein
MRPGLPASGRSGAVTLAPGGMEWLAGWMDWRDWKGAATAMDTFVPSSDSDSDSDREWDPDQHSDQESDQERDSGWESYLQPRGCVICGVACGACVLCFRHQGMYAQAAWVDQGLIGDWAEEVGSEPLNHRTMLIHPPVGPREKAAAAALNWRDQVAVITRRLGWWEGLPHAPDDQEQR